MEKWGDYHFGRCLQKWLLRSGQEVQTQYYGQWRLPARADVVLVLRGRHRYRGRCGGLRVLWVISHPEEVSREECALYDLVLVASGQYAQVLQSRLDVPVLPLLQCVDTEEFRPGEPGADRPRADLVFVGNTRDQRRECVLLAIESGLPLKVWGRGWAGRIPDGLVRGDYIDNRKLPGLYAGAKATFNDHWPDMRRCGFVNNRVFDALACGLPVISDHHEALEELFGDAVLSYRDRRGFEGCVERLMLQYPAVLDRVREAVQKVQRRHSFEVRVGQLLEVVRRHMHP